MLDGLGIHLGSRFLEEPSYNPPRSQRTEAEELGGSARSKSRRLGMKLPYQYLDAEMYILRTKTMISSSPQHGAKTSAWFAN
jgi:hypothetical protein